MSRLRDRRAPNRSSYSVDRDHRHGRNVLRDEPRNEIRNMNQELLEDKEQALHARLRSLGSAIVAYSGGVDSAYLAYAAHRALGERMLAVIADSASLARSHYRDAVEFARQQGIPLRRVETAELEREAYAANDANRCFHCKDELFTVLEEERSKLGFDAVAYGLNVDDRKDFRPGQ